MDTRMNAPTNPTLPGLEQSYTRQVRCSDLLLVITRANAAGWRAVGLTVLRSGYRVAFISNSVSNTCGSWLGGQESGARGRISCLLTEKNNPFRFPC